VPVTVTFDLAAVPVSAAGPCRWLHWRHGLHRLAIGNDRKRPAWMPGDFFGEEFGRR
jgi:hypothetical protein